MGGSLVPRNKDASGKPPYLPVPPLHSRFKPGQSGNPSGRPKTALVRKALLAHLEEAVKSAKGKKNGKTHLREVIESIVAEAKGGDHGVQAFTAIRDTVDGRPITADEQDRADRELTPHVTVNLYQVLGTLPDEALAKLEQAAREAKAVRLLPEGDDE